MADIINFNDFTEEPDLSAMDRPALLEYLAAVQAQIAQLDDKEPEDMESEEYEAWGDRHEELEDLTDEIQDILDTL